RARGVTPHMTASRSTPAKAQPSLLLLNPASFSSKFKSVPENRLGACSHTNTVRFSLSLTFVCSFFLVFGNFYTSSRGCNLFTPANFSSCNPLQPTPANYAAPPLQKLVHTPATHCTCR